MYCLDDNIVALATSAGQSALNVIRCSGPSILEPIKQIIKKPTTIKNRVCFLSHVYNPKNKELVDQAVVVAFLAPKSYTGQNVVELSVHGGNIIAKKIINLLIDCGCREALPGEFTYRAFINGKIDLIQAEAINSIVKTNNSLNSFYALKNIGGELSGSLQEVQNNLKDTITYIEHELDFNEEEIKHRSVQYYKKKIIKIIEEAQSIRGSSFLGNEKDADVEICIAGRPNVGKSSLFNELVGKKRSIVTEQSGTTRDFIDATFVINDMNIRLVDTAGIRKTKSVVEAEGIKRAMKRAASAHVVVFVSDKNPKKEFSLLKIKTNKQQKMVYVQNKADKKTKHKPKDVFLTSCLNKTGIKELYTELSTLINQNRADFLIKNRFLISSRVSTRLKDFIQQMKRVESLLSKESDLVVIVSQLYIALDIICLSISPVDKKEIINNIFKDFCVGK